MADQIEWDEVGRKWRLVRKSLTIASSAKLIVLQRKFPEANVKENNG
jgi:hypothetical protein